ncbi:MAG: glycosyl transferase family protein [Bacteroidetes bacterium]|nr:glycosyl transferase family protein [Bacteroidota bacterium]
MGEKLPFRQRIFSDTGILVLLALLKVAIHIPYFNSYGYFRDELYYIACSEHLAWGYVDQPPLSIFVLAIVRFLLGDSLIAIRIVPALAGAVTVFLAGLMARQLGGGRFAQILAALAVLTSPVVLGNGGRYFSMNSFDLLFWALAGYIVIVIVTKNEQRLWVLFGLIAGLGVLNKYSMGFFLAGLLVAMLLTSLRKQFMSKWFWMGGAIGVAIVIPHLLWEYRNGFPTLEFIHNATNLKNTPTPPWAFFVGQLRDTGFANSIIWILGLVFCLFDSAGKRYRFLGLLYALLFILMASQNSKSYYLTPYYPMLLAPGAVAFEFFTRKASRWFLKPVLVSAMLILGLVAAPFALPILPVDSFIQYQYGLGMSPPREERGQTGDLPQYYADMFGWPEFADTVASVYRRLTPEEQQECLIYVRNYGEAAAIDFFGRQHGLPRATCAHNSYWYWKPEGWSGKAAILLGGSRDTTECRKDLERFFEQVEFGAMTKSEHAMPYESGRSFFICRGAKVSLEQVWERDRVFM